MSTLLAAGHVLIGANVSPAMRGMAKLQAEDDADFCIGADGSVAGGHEAAKAYFDDLADRARRLVEIVTTSATTAA